MGWEGWPIERMLILFVSLAFFLIGIQVTMSHYRQNFHHKAMWVPVLAAPLFFVFGLILVCFHVAWLRVFFQFLMWVGALAGLVGFYFHVRGVGKRVGGYQSHNFLIGPPVIMPLMITAMSLLGIIALYWRA
ncbi:hypothetical protein [Paenibacillus popilliae]|uniref:Uncharacterized protein n=1 Tax=Paenibacillus popilliae TaxID=78057 RepID=A0ABY3AV49_PAEPP|nr:hypothetical protein [Paenibacillus sp. SDF0028]TQR46616.1 hypothetical protein C7Y44_02880 [Paenibacillus sp. SDF0028]